MADVKTQKVLVIPLLILYSGLLFIFAQNGQPGAWHEECINYWHHQKWQDLTSLADNLTSIGKADPETLYVGALAARQLGHFDQQQRFTDLLMRQHFLNPPMELEISAVVQPKSTFEVVRLFRSRLAVGITALLIILNLVMFRRRSPSVWQIILPVLGVTLLFL